MSSVTQQPERDVCSVSSDRSYFFFLVKPFITIRCTASLKPSDWPIPLSAEKETHGHVYECPYH